MNGTLRSLESLKRVTARSAFRPVIQAAAWRRNSKETIQNQRPARWFLQSRQEMVRANFIRQGHLGATRADKCENYFRSKRRTGLLIGFRSEGQGEIKYGPQVNGLGNGGGGWKHSIGQTKNSREQTQNKKIRSLI